MRLSISEDRVVGFREGWSPDRRPPLRYRRVGGFLTFFRIVQRLF